MRNLWLFLFRNRAFFWFLSFEVLAIFFIVRNNSFHGALFLSSANQFAGNVYDRQSQFKDYLYLNQVNDSLAHENVRLRQELLSSSYSDVSDVKHVKDTLHHIQYSFIVAKVINNSITRRDNYLTLNKGSLEGIKPDMGVISSMGIVGIIKDVSAHYSTAISVLNKESSFSVRLKKTKDIGSLVWDGLDSKIASLTNIPNHVTVKVGDSVETSGFSLFPEGIAVGRISKSFNNNGESFLTIDVKLNIDFNSLQYVYVVNNKLALEQKSLESKEVDKPEK